VGDHRGLDVPGDTVRQHGDQQGVRRWSKGFNRLQGRVDIEEVVLQGRTEGGTRRCVGSGGQKVKVREKTKKRLCVRKGVVAVSCSCKEVGCVQRN
jgi:hypothetical protein